MKTTFIYAHLEPHEDEIRYVGKSGDPWGRVSTHLRDSKTEKFYQARWLNSLTERGLKPRLEIIAEVPIEDWEFWERHYIKYFRDLGFRLTNATPGGDGTGAGEDHPLFGLRGKDHPAFGNKHTPETIAAMRATRAGVRKSSEHCEALRQSLTGVPHSPERRANNSASKKGKPLSSKCRDALTGLKRRSSTSLFRGVSWAKTCNKWRAGLWINGRGVSIGYFCKEEDAARAVDAYIHKNNCSLKWINFR